MIHFVKRCTIADSTNHTIPVQLVDANTVDVDVSTVEKPDQWSVVLKNSTQPGEWATQVDERYREILNRAWKKIAACTQDQSEAKK